MVKQTRASYTHPGRYVVERRSLIATVSKAMQGFVENQFTGGFGTDLF
jgi:hypothetical protein